MKSLQQMRKRLKKNQQITQEKSAEKKSPLIEEKENINQMNQPETPAETFKEVEKVKDEKQSSPLKQQQQQVSYVEQQKQKQNEQLNEQKNEKQNEQEQEQEQDNEIQNEQIEGNQKQNNQEKQPQQAQIANMQRQQSLNQVPQITRQQQSNYTKQINQQSPQQNIPQPIEIIQEQQLPQTVHQQQQAEKSTPTETKQIQIQQTTNTQQTANKNLQTPTLSPKKSKIQMLRQKIRLKKLAEQLQSSNHEIQQSPYKRSPANELEIQMPVQEKKTSIENVETVKLMSNEEKPVIVAQEERKQQAPIPQMTAMQVENHSLEQQKMDKVKNRVEDPKQTQNSKVIPFKPTQTLHFAKVQNKHTLFYQLNELNEYLTSNKLPSKFIQTPNPSHAQTAQKVKQFVDEIQRLKKNLSHCQ